MSLGERIARLGKQRDGTQDDRAMLVRLIQALLTRKRAEQALDLPA